MNTFEQMRSLLDAVLELGSLNAETMRILDSVLDSEAYRVLPSLEPVSGEGWSPGRLGLAQLRFAVELLDLWRNAGPMAALDACVRLEAVPLVAEPLEGRIYNLAVHLAELGGDTTLAAQFRDRLTDYAQRFLDPNGAVGLSGWAGLFDPDAIGWLAEFFEEEGREEPVRLYVPGSMLPLFQKDGASVTPEYRGHDGMASTGIGERPLDVLVLLDAGSGRLESLEVKLRDRTEGSDIGRWSRDGWFADLEFEFPNGRHDLAEWAMLGTLELLLSFSQHRFREFSVRAGTLLDLSGEGAMLRLSLRLPQDWIERDVPLALCLVDLEGALLARG